MRKIIQICSCGVKHTPETKTDMLLFALCNDGTLWEMRGRGGWLQIQGVPGSTTDEKDVGPDDVPP